MSNFEPQWALAIEIINFARNRAEEQKLDAHHIPQAVATALALMVSAMQPDSAVRFSERIRAILESALQCSREDAQKLEKAG